jgi:hypothetical protein
VISPTRAGSYHDAPPAVTPLAVAHWERRGVGLAAGIACVKRRQYSLAAGCAGPAALRAMGRVERRDGRWCVGPRVSKRGHSGSPSLASNAPAVASCEAVVVPHLFYSEQVRLVSSVPSRTLILF